MGGSGFCRVTCRGGEGGQKALTLLDRYVSEQAGPHWVLHLSCCLGVLKSDTSCFLFHPLLAFFFPSGSSEEKAPWKDL